MKKRYILNAWLEPAIYQIMVRHQLLVALKAAQIGEDLSGSEVLGGLLTSYYLDKADAICKEFDEIFPHLQERKFARVLPEIPVSPLNKRERAALREFEEKINLRSGISRGPKKALRGHAGRTKEVPARGHRPRALPGKDQTGANGSGDR